LNSFRKLESIDSEFDVTGQRVIGRYFGIIGMNEIIDNMNMIKPNSSNSPALSWSRQREKCINWKTGLDISLLLQGFDIFEHGKMAVISFQLSNTAVL
jgi:hypothetical protein